MFQVHLNKTLMLNTILNKNQQSLKSDSQQEMHDSHERTIVEYLFILH